MAETTCPRCDGRGTTPDTLVSAVSHRARTVNRKCRTCKGEGVVEVDTRTTRQRLADERAEQLAAYENDDSPEIPDWMMG